MLIRQLSITGFRGIQELSFEPGTRTVILGPQNAGKSTILEALDLLLHSGFGRPRPALTDVDYFQRKVAAGFEIQAVIGDLSKEFRAEVREHLEGWMASTKAIVSEPDGLDIEPVVRVRVRGTSDLSYVHEFAKPESHGSTFNPARRAQVGWIFDGRTRDPVQQLSFYQGGLLEKLFSRVDLGPAVRGLRDALGVGALGVNGDPQVSSVLFELGEDLKELGILQPSENPVFETGSVSRRELLQSLRLALPAGDNAIPLVRHGRGAQRLVLISVLLRLARASNFGASVIGGFEEPEEALEPLRQAQIAGMLIEIASNKGQIFVVTHSPEVARRFEIDDFVLMTELTAGPKAISLRTDLKPPVRQAYERHLDGAVVRGLFTKFPVLVEGPSDRALFETLWHSLAKNGRVLTPERLGIDVINCEGAQNFPMVAAVLKHAGKHVVAWVERDDENVRKMLERLRREKNYSALILYGTEQRTSNLERALATDCSLDALVFGMREIADDRGYDWESQKYDLISRCPSREVRTHIEGAANLEVALLGLPDTDMARQLSALALGGKDACPFGLKGGRQARIFGAAVSTNSGVPPHFAAAFEALYSWITAGFPTGKEIEMWQ